MLITYENYKAHCEEQGKEQVEASSFPTLSAKAERYLNMRTFGRLSKFESFSEEYKNKITECLIDLINVFYEEKTSLTLTPKASEKVGDYSVSFMKPSEIKKEFNEKKNDVVLEHLFNTYLLYCGVLPNDY
jgi:hypothetical protein